MFRKNKKLLSENNQLKLENTRLNNYLDSIQKFSPVIFFQPNGKIKYANKLFLDSIGYTIEEIIGKHHKIFCIPTDTNSIKYMEFWKKLQKGENVYGEFKRVKKDGSILWIEANYFPILDENSQVIEVMKIAHDITQKKEKSIIETAVLKAIDNSRAVIQFSKDGIIENANDNFLTTLGYSLSEIKGKHHKIFCDKEFLENNPNFWKNLAKGEFQQGVFKRISKSGKEVYIDATYNPIISDNQVVGVIKFARDITTDILRVQQTSQAVTIASTTSQQTLLVTQNAINVAQDANKLIDDLKVNTTQTTELIQKLHDSSNDITDIINTISSISDKTNLLALNAAIEAARAGQAGRGFAVVADEVRALSVATHEQTKHISSVIENVNRLTQQTIDKVMSTNEYVASTGDGIKCIIDVIQEVNKGSLNLSQVIMQIPSKWIKKQRNVAFFYQSFSHHLLNSFCKNGSFENFSKKSSAFCCLLKNCWLFFSICLSSSKYFSISWVCWFDNWLNCVFDSQLSQGLFWLFCESQSSLLSCFSQSWSVSWELFWFSSWLFCWVFSQELFFCL